MTELERKKGGGSKLSRSETVTVRLDPKLRYLAELASRKQRRTLSSYIEWAIEESLRYVSLDPQGESESTVAIKAVDLWDVDEADRFIKLAIIYPELLTHEEQLLWKVVKEEEIFWETNSRDQLNRFRYVLLRDCWEDAKKCAAGEISVKEFSNNIPIPF